MRPFLYPTVGQIVDEIQKEVKNFYLTMHPEMDASEYESLSKTKPKEVPTFERVQFYRLAKKLDFPVESRTPGRWRKYTPEEKEEIKRQIRKYYQLPESV